MYKHHCDEYTARTGQSRLFINKLFKFAENSLNRNSSLTEVDASYLRLFIQQRLEINSYPKNDFLFKYVKVVLNKLGPNKLLIIPINQAL